MLRYKMEYFPLVTVGLVTYNRPNYLKEAILSVLSQSYKNIELIVSNDYVSDQVSMQKLGIINDSRVRIINQSRNLGEIDNLNYVLNNAKGELFVWLADDDLMRADFILNCVEVFKYNPGLAAVFTNYHAGDVLPNVASSKESHSLKAIIFDCPLFILNYCSRNINLVGVYGLFKTDVLKKKSGIVRLGESFGPYSDNLIPLKIVSYGNVAWIDEELIFLRTHKDSQSASSGDLSAYISAEDDFLIEFSTISCLNDNEHYKGKVSLMRWFSENEVTVILRNELLRIPFLFMIFLKRQCIFFLPQLKVKDAILHALHIFCFLLKKILSRSFLVTKIIFVRLRGFK